MMGVRRGSGLQPATEGAEQIVGRQSFADKACLPTQGVGKGFPTYYSQEVLYQTGKCGSRAPL